MRRATGEFRGGVSAMTHRVSSSHCSLGVKRSTTAVMKGSTPGGGLRSVSSLSLILLRFSLIRSSCASVIAVLKDSIRQLASFSLPMSVALAALCLAAALECLTLSSLIVSACALILQTSSSVAPFVAQQGQS